jgi:hypothetical protein
MMGRPKQTLSATGIPRALLAQRGYANADALGPFTSGLRVRHYVVTIYEPDGTVRETLRGTFTELRDQITALPKR